MITELPSPVDDGLFIPEVGPWSHDKHYFLRRYLNAFTTAMGKKKWKGLHYIDLFAGAGIEKLEGTEQLEWGSPLLAAQAKRTFDRLHLCEKNKKKFNALTRRLEQFPQPAEAQILCGDANKKVAEIAETIPSGALSLAFLDPYGLHLNFSTLRILAKKKTDLIILFPDRVDALRNWGFYEKDRDSNLDRFLGEGVDWRHALQEAPNDKLPEVLRSLYQGQLRTLGYAYFESERILARRKPLYLLLFCTKHDAGLEIWNNVSLKKPDEQRTFGFRSGE